MGNIAHTKNNLGKQQGLEEHLLHVAEMARRYSTSFGGEIFAYYAGLAHDIGKYDPAFQEYLLDAETHPGQRQRGPDHKSAGAVLAEKLERRGILASILFGHHGGIPDRPLLQTTIRDRQAKKTIQAAIATAKAQFPELENPPQKLFPAYVHSALELEFFARIAFSALVDADFLDTEQHFNAGERPERSNRWNITNLWHTFAVSYQRKFANAERSVLNTIRSEVYEQCVHAAPLPPGFFRLTVPTGGGKTLASLAFALRHAQIHSLERVIYALPYTSIIDQTVKVFHDLFGDEQAFLEHHSDISMPDPEHPTPSEIRRRLRAENWDAPLIATTTVQLFESLLGHGTSKCRKLHNIVKSVIVLDEVQTLPVYFLTPILDVLRELCTHYGVTVLLCTATQPDFESRQNFEGLSDIREIVPHPEHSFASLKRVEYQLPKAGETWTWRQVADRVRAEPRILVIVNTRRDATELLSLLTDDDERGEEEQSALFHLSTRLCSEHRKAVLEEVHRRLKAKEPCRLIATQVIEAGVDVDFPLVMRALGPLDSLVQAAGRANREGKMSSLGRVIVFVPEDGHTPKGSYQVGTDIATRLLKDGQADLHDPTLYQRYFQEYYSLPYRDHSGIQELRKHFNYPEVAQKFRLIDASTPAIVTYEPAIEKISKLLDRVQKAKKPHRDDLRALQPYMVNVSTYEFEQAKKNALVSEIIADVWTWRANKYDSGKDGKHGQGILFDGTWSADNLLW